LPHAPTPEQRRAIEAPAGPVLVVAGPGAGKTFCLIERVRHLLGPLGLAPERICAITFTNKAADEISHRLSAEVGPAARHVTRGTLHALCLKLLREFPEAVGLRPGFGVADEEYQRALLRLFRVKDEACGRVLTLFGRARHEERATLEPSLDRLFGRYRETLHRRNLVDFDDLIVHAKTLLETDAARRAEIAGRWDAILVDEFQDLTPTQYRIVALLAQDHRHVFGVGDDEQAIYGWAGADAGILKVFQQEFGIPEEIVLTTNHRNSRAIFDAARRLVQTNPSLFHKQLVARHEGMFPVEVRTFPDERAEVEWLVADLRADREAHGLAWGDVAVLVRAHRLGQRLETALLRARVPVRAARGRAIAEDPIAGPVLAAFRLVQSPADQVPVELLARRFLTAEMLEVLRARYPGMHLVRALRQYDNEPSTPKPEGRRAMRLFYHVTNLPGLARTARSQGDFVDALLEQRPSERRTPLEERADDLTDPEELPAVRDLADGLRRVRALPGPPGRRPRPGRSGARRRRGSRHDPPPLQGPPAAGRGWPRAPPGRVRHLRHGDDGHRRGPVRHRGDRRGAGARRAGGGALPRPGGPGSAHPRGSDPGPWLDRRRPRRQAILHGGLARLPGLRGRGPARGAQRAALRRSRPPPARARGGG